MVLGNSIHSFQNYYKTYGFKEKKKKKKRKERKKILIPAKQA